MSKKFLYFRAKCLPVDIYTHGFISTSCSSFTPQQLPTTKGKVIPESELLQCRKPSLLNKKRSKRTQGLVTMVCSHGIYRSLMMTGTGESTLDISKVLHSYFPNVRDVIYDGSCKLSGVCHGNEPVSTINRRSMLSDEIHSSNHHCTDYYRSKTIHFHNHNIHTELGEQKMQPLAKVRNTFVQQDTTSAMTLLMYVMDKCNSERIIELKKQAQQ